MAMLNHKKNNKEPIFSPYETVEETAGVPTCVDREERERHDSFSATVMLIE